MADAQAPVRLEFFYGKPTEDPFQWVESFELFIEINQLVGDRVLRFVKHAMREEAYTWFRANQDDIVDWEDCKEAFLERFGLDEDTLMSKVDSCMQQPNENVRSYADRFRKLTGYLPNPLPVRMITKIFVKGLVPHLRERVQMTYPGNGALSEIIHLAANYEQTFGHEPIGAVYSNQNLEAPPRERNEQWHRRPIDNADQRAPRPPQQQNHRENARDNRDNRNWPRQRDLPERRNQQPPAAPRPMVPYNPPREAPVPPPVNDIDTLTKEMERLRIQIAELQRPVPAANFTQFQEDRTMEDQPQARIMYDGFTDPFPVYPIYATKRPAENPPEADPAPLRRRPNNLENTTVDPRNPPRPAAPRPTPAQHQQHEPRTPAAPPPAPARGPAPRAPADLGGLPPLPNVVRPAAYRRPVAITPAITEPIQQIKGLPMKLSVQSYFNHISEEEFQRSIQELQESRRHFLQARHSNLPRPRDAEAEMVVLSRDTSEGLSASDTPEGIPQTQAPQLNLQRHIVNTTVATVPILINDLVFEDGIIDTGATNTMISQSAARQLNLMDQIEPSRLRYSCADGKMSTPWGIIRKLPVGVEGLVIPIDVFVSGATSYDVLLGTDWLTQAHAEISFAKQEMSFRIEPHILGRVPITVMPASKRSNRYCITRVPELDFGGPAEHPADPGVPVVPVQPEVINIDTSTSEEEGDFAACQDEVTSTNISKSGEDALMTTVVHQGEYEFPLPPACNATINNEEEVTTSTEYPDLSEEWSLKKQSFKELETLWGPFDIDACCDTHGLNAQLPQYWSPQQDCLQQNWTHKKVYCNPPFSRIDEIVSHCLACFEASPHTTSAILVLPCWPNAPWFSKVSQHFNVVKEYPIGSEIAIDIGCSPEESECRTCAIPWPIIVVSTHAAKRVRDPGLPQVIAVPADAVVRKDNSQSEVPTQPRSAAVQSEVVNVRLPSRPRDEHSPESLERSVYKMYKPQFDNSQKASSSPTSPHSCTANANLCGIVDNDHFGPTIMTARVTHPILEPYHFKSIPQESTWSAKPSLGWMHKCCSVKPRVSEFPTGLAEMMRKGLVSHPLKRFKVAYTTAGRILKDAASLRRKIMYEKKLVSKDLSPSNTFMECWSLEMDGLCKQGAAATAVPYCETTLMDQGPLINVGDAASAVPFESHIRRAATNNETYEVPCSKDDVQGVMQNYGVCRMQPSPLESFYYHGYLNKEYAIPRCIRAMI